MKKILVGLVAALFSFVTFAAGLNTYDGIAHTNLLAPTYCVGGTAVTGTARNIASTKGIGAIVLNLSCAYGITNATYGANIRVQDSSTGTGGWTNVTDLTLSNSSTNTGASSVIKVDTSTLKQFLRVIVTSTNDFSAGSAILHAWQ